MSIKINIAVASCFIALGSIYSYTLQTNVAPGTDVTPITYLDTALSSPVGSILTADDSTTSPYTAPKKEPPTTATTDSMAPKKVAKKSPPETYVTIEDIVYPLRTYSALALPNDPLVNQWWVPQAQFEPMWEIPRGASDTTIAIIDTGFALKHEEFINRWKVNAGESGSAATEQPSTLNCADRGLILDASCNLIDDDSDTIVDNEIGPVTYQNPSRLNCTGQLKPLTRDCNRVDDDLNGLIDDTTGWDFINNDNSSQAGELNPSGTGTTHGTLVAGVAAATGNNGKGIAGVDWGTKILPIQALDDDSYGDTRSVGRAIFYAVSRGVDVISLSLGSTLSDDYVKRAIEAATKAGIVVVASSGNDGCECIAYPANYPEVVAVGALNSNSQIASFSSWGANIDIVAPGTQITSPTWQSANQTSAYASGVNGTSFSAPMIGGMLTRMLSHQPTATPLQLIAGLTENTNRLSLPSSIPHDPKLGFGTLNALKATSRMTIPKNAYQLYSFTPISQGNYLNPSAPAEQVSTDTIYACDADTIPTTQVTELTKTGLSFYTASKSEVFNAILNGYTSRQFAYACHQQPHDTTTVDRQINIFHEFKNIYSRQ